MRRENVLKTYESTAQERKLYLLVTEGEKEICSVQMPLAASESLENLFPEHVAQGILPQLELDFTELGRRVVESNFCSQEIIDASLGQRRYEVWIQ